MLTSRGTLFNQTSSNHPLQKGPTWPAAHLLQHCMHGGVGMLQRLAARHARFPHKQAADVKQAFMEQVLRNDLRASIHK